MTTKQMADWDDGTVGFQSMKQVAAGELRDAIVVHPHHLGAGVIVEFSTELHYGGGAKQCSESSIALNPEQAATFARALSAPRRGGLAVHQFEAEAMRYDKKRTNVGVWTDGVMLDCDMAPLRAFDLELGKRYRVTVEELG